MPASRDFLSLWRDLTAVVPLLTSTRDARDLAIVHRIVGKVRQRWPAAAELRQFDELLGLGSGIKRA